MINFKKHQVPLRNFISRHPKIKKKKPDNSCTYAAFMITVHFRKVIQVCVAFNAHPQHHLKEDGVVVS